MLARGSDKRGGDEVRMVIAGGRDFKGCQKDLNNVVAIVQKYNITEIVSGDAKGADFFGEYCAEKMNIPVKKFKPDWSYGHMAGPIRNAQMAEYTDYVFLFPGGRGTSSMRMEALKVNKQIVYDNGREV